MRHLEGQLQNVRRTMDELSQQTRHIAGRSFYVEVHRKNKGECHRLVWRLGVGRNGHTTWPALQEQRSALPVASQRYYAEVEEQIRWLNAREQVIRFAMQTLKKLIQGEEGGNRTR